MEKFFLITKNKCSSTSCNKKKVLIKSLKVILILKNNLSRNRKKIKLYIYRFQIIKPDIFLNLNEKDFFNK